MKNLDFVEAFKDHLVEEEKSKGTIEGYLTDVKGFLDFIKKDIKKITKKDLVSYKESLKNRVLKVEMVTGENGKLVKVEHKMKTPSINRKLIGVKRFIDFINEHFNLEITARVKQEKVQKQYSLNDEELLSFEDYQKLIAAVEGAGDIRTKALFEAMYYTGMRVHEMLQLRVDHVENGLKVIKDIKGKGGKYRPIFISNEKLRKSLQEYLEVRKQPYSSTTKALFVGERGPLTRQTAHHLMKKYAKLAGIELKKAHVHNFRHLFGLRLADQGVPIQDIAKYMGHSSIEITRIYLEKTESEYAEGLETL